MKKILTGCCSLIMMFACAFSITFGGDDYYWSGGKKIRINQDKSSLLMIYKEKSVSKNSKVNHSQVPSVLSAVVSADKRMAIVAFDKKKEKSIAELVAEMNVSLSDLEWYSFGYEYENGSPIRPTNRISFLMKVGHDLSLLESLLGNRATYDRTPFGTLMLKVSNPKQDIVALANEIYESGIVEYCHPDFVAQIAKHDDPLYWQHYFLNNWGQFGGANDIDIDAPQAWNISVGSSLTSIVSRQSRKQGL